MRIVCESALQSVSKWKLLAWILLVFPLQEKYVNDFLKEKETFELNMLKFKWVQPPHL